MGLSVQIAYQRACPRGRVLESRTVVPYDAAGQDFHAQAPRPRPPRDVNIEVYGWLTDLALAQSTREREWAYKRAAATVLGLPEPLGAYREDEGGALRKLPNIGPATTRVLLELLEEGASSIVERAVLASPKRSKIESSRRLRHGFLSHAGARRGLHRRNAGVRAEDYGGDLQMHSLWSDGDEPLDVIVEACLARGYRFSCITDHSYGLAIARGLGMEDLRRQHEEVDRLNVRHRGRFRLFKGIETNIRPDGSVDMSRDELRRLELVVAAPHSLLRSPADQTDRMVTAVSQPGVHILGHPRGRRYGVRAGVLADWDAVFARAAESGVAVELDGSIDRQDLDYELAARALGAGCLFALDSDAHSLPELDFTIYALAHARIAGIPADRVINCWTEERLLDWAARAWRR
jgi:putative hydrolase